MGVVTSAWRPFRPDDVLTYDMIGRADTIGVFQIESRAQMAMLPRLALRCFYDLVIEVAIVRPGPIQGDMVHPYLRRRNGEEPIDYPPALHAVFERTLGVPLFQEQVMQLSPFLRPTTVQAKQMHCVVSMAAWSRRGGLEPHRERLLQGMRKRATAMPLRSGCSSRSRACSYGFPESHAASFALITYVSCWLVPSSSGFCLCLDQQPAHGSTAPTNWCRMRRHGCIQVYAIDVQRSEWMYAGM